MNFWDTSAMLPLVIQEKTTEKMIDLKERSDSILAWTLTPVEGISSLCRLQRMGHLDETDFQKSLKTWNHLMEEIFLVRDVEAVKERAVRLLRTHVLRAADALQLASALVACSDVTSGHGFVSLNGQLSQAASKEGFLVIFY